MTSLAILENCPASVTALAEEVFQNRSKAAGRLRAYADKYPASPLSASWSCRADSVEAAPSAADLCRTSDGIRFLPFLSGRSSALPLDPLDAVSPWMFRWDRWLPWLYPIVTMMAASIVVALILWFLVPGFDAMFQEFQLDVPAPTFILLGMSRVLRQYPFGVLIVATMTIAGGFGMRGLWQRLMPQGEKFRGRSESLKQAAMLADSIAAWIESGTSVHESIQLAGLGCDDDQVREFLWRISERMPLGDSPHRLGIQRVVPPTLAHAVSQTSPNIDSLRMYASLYRSRAIAQGSSWFVTLLPYITIILVGAFVAFTIIALFAPMVSLITGLTS